jgi:RES domain-containing protein
VPIGIRLIKSKHLAIAFDGEGARQYGGRWNSPGTAVVYTAQSESLAALELLVHLQSSQLLMSYSVIPVEFNDRLLEVVGPATLPRDWRYYPAPSILQEVGDRWAFEQRSVVLQVPSAIVSDEVNYVLNPRHPGFAKITIGKPKSFKFDPRLT